MAWSSLSAGFFSERVQAGGVGTRPGEAADRLFGSTANYARRDRARAVARSRGLTVPQVVLAYLLAQDVDVFPIVGSKQISHFRQNMAAIDVRLSPDEVAWLEYAGQRPV